MFLQTRLKVCNILLKLKTVELHLTDGRGVEIRGTHAYPSMPGKQAH